MRRTVILSLCIILSIQLLFAQKKTLLKFEFPVSILTDQGMQTAGQSFTVLYPTLYIPLHKHIDIGAGYTSQKANYYVKESAGGTDSYFSGSIKYKVTSFYFKLNLSASQKRVNPFFGYILSFSKGTYTSPTPYTGSLTQNFTYLNGFEYNDNYYSYTTRMTPAEEDVLKKSLNKSQLSHGAQLGIDFRILPFLNLFVKATSFSVLGYQGWSEKERPFSVYYKDERKEHRISPQMHFMGGIILKIDAGKKSLIK